MFSPEDCEQVPIRLLATYFLVRFSMATSNLSSRKLSMKMEPDRKVGKHFRVVGKRIGVGNFGEVRLGVDIRNDKK